MIDGKDTGDLTGRRVVHRKGRRQMTGMKTRQKLRGLHFYSFDFVDLYSFNLVHLLISVVNVEF